MISEKNMKYLSTTSILISDSGEDKVLLPVQVAPAWDNQGGNWLADIRVVRTSALLRKSGGRLVVETQRGARPSLADHVALEGPSFVKEVRQHGAMPLLGDLGGWESRDGEPLASWGPAFADSPPVGFWVNTPKLPRVMPAECWMLPCLGAVSYTDPGSGLAQPCAPVGVDGCGWFTPMIPMIPDGPRSFLGSPEGEPLAKQLEELAWSIMTSPAPKKLWVGWAMYGPAKALSAVLPDRLPDTLMPYPMGSPRWVHWWEAAVAGIDEQTLWDAVHAVTTVTSVHDDRFVERDVEVARRIMDASPLYV